MGTPTCMRLWAIHFVAVTMGERNMAVVLGEERG